MRGVTIMPTILGLLLIASPGLAAPRRGARLTWARGTTAGGCVGAMGLQEDVKARLGYDPFVLTSELSIEGAVMRANGSYRAELVTRDTSGGLLGTRQLASREADCRSLGEAVAVAITVAIDPEAAERGSAAIEEVPLAPPPPGRELAPVPETTTPPSRGRAEVAVGASAGLLPGVGVVASLRALRSFGSHWELGVGAHFWPEQRVERLGFALATATIEACATPWTSTRWLRWCSAAHFGLFQVFVHAHELTPVEVGMFPWAGLSAGPAWSVHLAGPLRLDASVAAVLPIVRRQALLAGRPSPVWEQSPVGGQLDLGLSADF